jgi:hypothetical protein
MPFAARRLIRALGACCIMRFDMNRTLSKVAVASIILINACASKQTLSNSANQNMNQSSVTPSIALTQNNSLSSQQSDRTSSKPKRGYVPDEQTAISIAVAVWIPLYGRELIEGEKPYKATLKNGVWTVTGSVPEGYEGGAAEAQISQDSGCILRIIHYQ